MFPPPGLRFNRHRGIGGCTPSLADDRPDVRGSGRAITALCGRCHRDLFGMVAVVADTDGRHHAAPTPVDTGAVVHRLRPAHGLYLPDPEEAVRARREA